MGERSVQQATDLSLIEICALRGIFDREGASAFDRASRHLLMGTAALIAEVSGIDRLDVIMCGISAFHHDPDVCDLLVMS